MKRFVRRKWGWYLVLLDRKHFKVKLLKFYDGKSCSMQKHYKRNELWLWLYGAGELETEDSVLGMKSGQFMTIPKECWHQYKADKETMILEIQYGERCEEEDIVRI